jgi:hypothetical protein
MSASWNEQRRVAAIRAAQRTEEAQRYLLEVRRLQESDDLPPLPEVGIDTGGPERAGAPEAPLVPHAALRSSLRQAVASESWDAAPTGAADVEPATPQELPGSTPKPTPMPQPAPPPPAAHLPQAEGPSPCPEPSPTMSTEVALVFDIGVQEMARPPASAAPPALLPDDVPCDEDPVAVRALPVDHAIVAGRGPHVSVPSPSRSTPRHPPVRLDAPPPAVAMPMPHEAAAAFEPGAREMTAPPAPAAPPQVRDPAPRTAQRTAAPGPAPVPTPEDVAAAFDAGAREMASPQARLPMPPAPVQVEASMPSPSTSEPAQPQPTPGHRAAATAFDAGVRDIASPPPRPPPSTPPPHADAVDERQSAQLALDARLAQLTFRGILTHGGG